MSTHTSVPLLLLLLASITSSTTGSAILPLALSPRQSGSIFLGRPCTPGSTTCLGGAQCYAVNSMLIPTCGNFAATCSSSAQCATNTCVNGACNGPVAPVLPLGTPCYESAQCEGGAQCYAVNSMQIPSCGNFQAQCVSDAQCAFDTCVDGFCSGPPPMSSSSSASVPPTTSVTPTTSVAPTSASTTAPTSATSLPMTSSSGLSSSPSSSGIVPPTSMPTGGSTTTVTTFTTTTSCPSVSTTMPPPTGTGHSSVIGNSTMPTTASPSPTLFQGAGEQLRAGVGSIIVAAALGFALMIGA